MARVVEKKKDKVSTIIPLKRGKGVGTPPVVTEKDYRKFLEEKIKEKIVNRETQRVDITGKLKENIEKKKRWMGELISAILEIKDILEKTKLIRITLNDFDKLIIQSIDYDEARIVKTGFKLDIDFFERSSVLNNKQDCYLVQLLGKDVLQDNMRKFIGIDSLMDFVINYCSDYIAEQVVR